MWVFSNYGRVLQKDFREKRMSRVGCVDMMIPTSKHVGLYTR